MTKILSWNIRQGGGKRIHSILNELESHSDATIIILTEFRSNKNGELITEFLYKSGFSYQAIPKTDTKTNTVLLASKTKVSFEFFEELQEHTHRVVCASFSGYRVFATYFPQKNEKSILFDFLLNMNSLSHLDTMIIAGDMNTGRHHIDETGKSFFQSRRFENLIQSGMIDAWRFIHGDSREYSWYSNKGNGFRIDHFFISDFSKDLVQDCYYRHEVRENKISDHSQMILILDK